MYPNFQILFQKLFGIDVPFLAAIQSFGFFLMLTFLVGGYLYNREVMRREQLGWMQGRYEQVVIGEAISWRELLIQGFWGFVIGAKALYIMLHFAEFTADTPSVLLSLKGNIVGGLLGAGLFAYLAWNENKKTKLDKPIVREQLVMPSHHTNDFVVAAAISGVLGSKIFALMETPKEFLADPLGQLFSGSGMAIYGGLIGAFIFVYWYAQRRGMNMWHMMDAAAPALMIGYGIGRIGCEMSGDGDWGIVNTMPKPSFIPQFLWASTYPNNVAMDGVPIPDCVGKYCFVLPEPVFPTPLYETLMAFAIGAVLLYLSRRIKTAGVLFFIYMILNGIERFFIEKVRINTHYDWLPFQATQAQFIALCFVLIGIAGIYLRTRSAQSSSAS
jgi:phosphatidylglycerol:prolipoprotein diacylglycerol transferase